MAAASPATTGEGHVTWRGNMGLQALDWARFFLMLSDYRRFEPQPVPNLPVLDTAPILRPAMAPIFSTPSSDRRPPNDRLRVVSWNLLRRVVGSGGIESNVAKLVKSHHPDLLLLQECTEEISKPALAGGRAFFSSHPMQARIYGLAAWSPHPFPQSNCHPAALFHPAGTGAATAGRRSFPFMASPSPMCNLSHGQFLKSLPAATHHGADEGPAAIIGDFNAVGPVGFQGFSDIRAAQAQPIAPAKSSRCGWTAVSPAA